MEHVIIPVPKGIRFISDWSLLENGYRIENYPYPHIINKQLTGCGFTEYCIRNDQNIILCSPRKILLENKEDQHQGEVFYARSITVGDELKIDSDLSKDAVVTAGDTAIVENTISPGELQDRALELQRAVKYYYYDCLANKRPCKILVTYDSFRHVADALKDCLISFNVVVDEFQSIFVDSRFKSSTESEFLNYLRGVQKVCFVSATPMIDKYLEMLDEFKDLPYYEFDWRTEDSTRIIRPRLNISVTKSIISEISQIILEYRSGDFQKASYLNEEGKLVEIESREAVFYVNSVDSIKKIIVKNKLKQDECNILCARTQQNEEKIRKAFGVAKKDFLGLGYVPKKGEHHKMFTFCTRTVYLGADFYSTNARSFIFSDSNVDCLAVDISLDLPQILGRQRLDENPWKNSADLYFKSTFAANIMKEEELDTIIQEKVRRTNSLLKVVNELTDPSQKMDIVKSYDIIAKTNKYKDDYISVNYHQGTAPVSVFNKLVMVSERRAFDIQQVDYKDRFMVFKSLNKIGDFDVNVDEQNEALVTFDSLTTFIDKMKFLCTNGNGNFSQVTIQSILPSIPLIFGNYYNVIGPDKIKALSYQKSKLEDEYKILQSGQKSEAEINNKILESFEVGKRYRSRDIKDILQGIYDSFDYKRSARATSIGDLFDVKECLINDPITKKRDKGFEILSRKE